MIECSLNEVETYARRAARGAGMSWGLAEEAGKAVRWLAARRLPAVALLADLLTRNDGRGYTALAPVLGVGAWHAPGGTLCPICTGAALSDRPGILAVAGERLALARTACPLLLAPFLPPAAGAGVALAWDGMRLLVSGDGECRVEGETAALAATSAESVVIGPVLEPPVARATSAGPVAVSEDIWRRIAAFAQRTCVPASEASRTRGAGAGVRDND